MSWHAYWTNKIDFISTCFFYHQTGEDLWVSTILFIDHDCDKEQLSQHFSTAISSSSKNHVETLNIGLGAQRILQDNPISYKNKTQLMILFKYFYF